MRLGLRELRRTPGRFMVATMTLTLIAILLLFISGLLDGLVSLATGGLKSQPGQLIVLAADSKDSLAASRIDERTRAQVAEAVPDARIGGLATLTLGARSGGDQGELKSVTLRGYELAPDGVPGQVLPAGQVWADADLSARYQLGQELLLGADRTPVTIAGFVPGDAGNPSQGSLWGSMQTWRTVLAAARPGAALPDGVSQGLVVDLPTQDADAVKTAASAIEAAVGSVHALTLDEASNAIPGVSAQRSTFGMIIGITAIVAVAVIGLFFALLTVERAGLYGVLKALGASGKSIFSGVISQALIVTAIASAAGLACTLAAVLFIPPGTVPFAPTATGIVGSLGLLALAAVLGSVFSLRQVLRVDPANAIGGN